ncbi:MAG: integrase family protein [Rubrivivax sp.]|nr:integrase family protein [Rubrivivax sp.]
MARVNLTRAKVDGFKCPADKAQAFLWDATAPGLGLRMTPTGKPSYVFQSLFQGRTLRLTIGSPDAWTIPNAQARARELQRQIDEGRDPRAVKAAATAADVASREDAKRQSVTVSEAWAAYLLERRPHWGERHYQDHVAKAAPGGVPGKRSKSLQPGILAPLMAKPLRDLDAATIEAWAAREARNRPTSARLAWRLLKAFLGWCAEQPAYAGAVPDKNPAKSKKARESLGRPGVKADALQREQLPAWFDAVRGIHNPVVAAYLQTVLLTGARPGEVLEMQWEDLNTKWKGLTIRDKVEGERTVPLTPYVAHLLAALPRRNQWVFSGARADVVAAPNELHARACGVAGIDGLSLHGLRRSFKSLTEWLEIPAGVVAQLMGHKPSATAERHYTVRPLDLLRVHHERIEAWILEQAKVEFDAAVVANAGGLQLVSVA